MAFVFNGPPPSVDDHHPHHETSTSSFFPFLHHPPENTGDMQPQHHLKDKDRPRLEILLDKECIYLKGTGVDVESARLSGHVALYLLESTSIKEITLQFRGKARLPATTHEPTTLNSAPLTYIVCNHEWSFLEGEKKHSHTLKAGRHLFPFQLQLGGSLPSSISTTIFGGASVAYKLRAHVSRPGFNNNLQAVIPVNVVRSFAPEALEYQQTLEIENTWPEKIMYSIMIPHKAWAAGDTLTALVKFSPLLKGVGVLNINTSINETTKVYSKSGHQEASRVAGSAKHEIIGGKAVEVNEDHHQPSKLASPLHPQSPSGGPPNRLSNGAGAGNYFTFNPQTHTHTEPEAGPSTFSSRPSTPPPPDGFELSQDDIVTYLSIRIPLTITPTHGLDPIIVTHRIRWSILLVNPDGHTSELRCSLPIHLLDHRLYEEARMHTTESRRLLVGSSDVTAANSSEVDDDMELPSYSAHLRDRVANMYLPESVMMRVTNPWIRNNVSPVAYPGDLGSPWPLSPSGCVSQLEAQAFGVSSLPSSPRSEGLSPGLGGTQALEWVNSELLLSLTDSPPDMNMTPRIPPSPAPPSFTHPPTPGSGSNSEPDSYPSSRYHSRPGSRSSSPERSSPTHSASSSETYIHSHCNASRNVHGVFKNAMKPFTSMNPASGWLHSSRSGSHGNLASMVSHSHGHGHGSTSHSPHLPSSHLTPDNTSPPSSRPTSSHEPPGALNYTTGTALLHRAFTEVPEYNVANRGFLGGVPPLSSLRGLPSYEEASGSGSGGLSTPYLSPQPSEGDLVERFGRASVST
ncbi:hypothetical protein E1B28_000392 [Marasmius oreades]|uniref:Arrestin C-terminal-like domain-containing protein n=1 Tax=Marasmius oreades TaxID=181124 RepID=A0A9P8AE25_9AGAR|nr:uncharacterized protein E1B28_000392 [Marasmius oreades]KAG7098441.1 hypothetical protein E1B28_000392 [Marasmius oreades]